MLTITNVGEGTCIWCRKKEKGAQAKFDDGLAGFFCRRHLWEAMTARKPEKEVAGASREAAGKPALTQ